MGLKAGLGRLVAAPLILFNLLYAIIILGLAGRELDRSISNGGFLSGFQGNGATPYLMLFSWIAGVVAIASYIVALHHMRVWRSESGAASQAVSWIAWLFLIIASGISLPQLPIPCANEEIHIGDRAIKLRVLEVFVIILFFPHFFYILALHLEDSSEGDSGKYYNNKPLNPSAPTNTTSLAATAI